MALLRNSLSSNERKYEPVAALINRRLSVTPNKRSTAVGEYFSIADQ